jgi:hypothetical protein
MFRWSRNRDKQACPAEEAIIKDVDTVTEQTIELAGDAAAIGEQQEYFEIIKNEEIENVKV